MFCKAPVTLKEHECHDPGGGEGSIFTCLYIIILISYNKCQGLKIFNDKAY